MLQGLCRAWTLGLEIPSVTNVIVPASEEALKAITTALVGSHTKAADTLRAIERKDRWTTTAPIQTMAPSEQTPLPFASPSNLNRECSGNLC